MLTWLGAGDVVDMGTAGANYGYSLLWVFVVAVVIRFLFVSLIARYQLCNQHGEGVLDGLVRLHPRVCAGPVRRRGRDGPRLRVLHDARNRRGLPQPVRLRRDLAVGRGVEPARRCIWSSARATARWKLIFLFFLAVLSVSFLGCAIWVGFDPGDVARGLVRVEMPGRQGATTHGA